MKLEGEESGPMVVKLSNDILFANVCRKASSAEEMWLPDVIIKDFKVAT